MPAEIGQTRPPTGRSDPASQEVDDRTKATVPRRSRGTARKIQTWAATGILIAVVLSAALAPIIVPYGPTAMSLGEALQPPSLTHPFGTDPLGRDILSRTIYGARVSLLVAFCAVLIAGTVGGMLGIVAGYFGGIVDAFIMRLADVQFSLPAIILALFLVGTFGSGLMNLIIILSLANWARFARVLRSEALSLRMRDYVMLARLAGASHLRVILLHVAPNTLGTFIVLVTLDVGIVIILEATLSFLGLGVQPPNPSWGTLIADGRQYLSSAWWIAIFPGLILMMTVLAGNIAGDSLRDRFSPTLSTRW